MASGTPEKRCATCRKSGDVFTCLGCRKAFCAKHIDLHRQKLSKLIETLAQKHEILRNDVNRENEAQLLITTVTKWEQESIAKISLAAETARTDLRQWIDRNNIEVKIPLERTTNELRACQQSDDYTEIDLRRWNKQLEEYRQKIEKLPIIDKMDNTHAENIHLIKLIKGGDQKPPSPVNHSPVTVDGSTISSQVSSLLIRERFDDIHGGATLFEGGLVVTYAGTWLGDSSACGINLYSSGTHHIRFRVIEKFYDSPFFGIITASQKNIEHVLGSVSTNGWENFDFPIVNGEKDLQMGRDKLIRPLDELTLTLDCDRKQIFLKHDRTKRLLHLPIDLRACPFPWKMLVVLHRRGDSVCIAGGTLSLTRANLSSKLCPKRKI